MAIIRNSLKALISTWRGATEPSVQATSSALINTSPAFPVEHPLKPSPGSAAEGIDAGEHELGSGRLERRAWDGLLLNLADTCDAGRHPHITNQSLADCYTIIEETVTQCAHFDPDIVCRLLGFTSDRDNEYIARVAEIVIIPLTKLLYRLDLASEAERLAHWMLTVYGHRLSSEATFSTYIQGLAAAATECGRRFAERQRFQTVIQWQTM